MNTNENLRYIDKYLSSYSNIANTTKENKQYIITKFVNYIDKKGVILKNLMENDITNYIHYIKSQFKYRTTTIYSYKTELRLFLNWAFQENITSFSGENICRSARTGYRENIITSYNIDEIKNLLDSIDINTKYGKLMNALMSLFIYYGIRVGDVVNLKFENINWENNEINIIQQKTKLPLILPLIEPVKFSLLDYLKNSREKSNTDYIFIKTVPPFEKYTTSGIYSIVEKSFINAKININGKHHGPHSLRSSLATNMIKNNVPLGEICKVLGHSTTKTTEQYITKDTTHLKELALEVPYE